MRHVAFGVVGAVILALPGSVSAQGITVDAGNGIRVADDASSDQFTVALTVAPTDDVVLSVESSDVGEATVTPRMLQFTTADWNVPKTVTVMGVQDNLVDGLQAVVITIAVDAATVAAEYSSVGQSTIAAVVNDDAVRIGDGAEFRGFVGAGWAGIKEPFLFETAVIDAAGAIDPNLVYVEKESRFVWRPTLVTGIEWRDYIGDWPAGVPREGSDPRGYWGLSGFVAALSTEQTSNAVAPGFSVNFGKGRFGMIVGYVLTASDKIYLPPNGGRKTLVNRSSIPDFVIPNGSEHGRFVIAFRGVSFDLPG